MNNYIMYENVANVSNISGYQNDYNYLIVNDTKQYDFVQVVLSVGKIRQAVCYELKNGEVLVGALTEPLFSLSERLILMQDIEKKVNEITGKKVYVTFDTDLFVAISKCKDDEKAGKLKELIFMRNSARM